MIFLDQMKNLKIYRKPVFLPTLENDKKKKSAIMLLTPNYESSKRLMNHPLLINRLRFQSYYLEQDVSYYINGKVSKNLVNENYVFNSTHYDLYQNINEMSIKDRNRLSSSSFGLPKERKYPLDTEDHVRSAVRFFNYVSKEDEKELAENIIKAINKFNLNIKVGPNNRLSKYYKPEVVNEYCSVDFNNEPDKSLEVISIVIANKENEILLVEEKGTGRYTLPNVIVSSRQNTRDDIVNLMSNFGLSLNNYELESTTYYADCKEHKSYNYFENKTYFINQYDKEPYNGTPEKYESIVWMTRDDIATNTNIKISELLISYVNNWRIKENDISDTLVDSLTSYIYFNGYAKDIEVVRKIITPGFYYETLCKKLCIPIHNSDDIPVLRIEIDREPKIETGIYPRTEVIDGIRHIIVKVPAYSIGDLKLYILDIYKKIYHGILISCYPNNRDNKLCIILEDYLTENNTIFRDYGKYLFEDRGITIPQYIEMLKFGDSISVYKMLVEKFHSLRIHDIDINPQEKDSRFTNIVNNDHNHNKILIPANEETIFESYIFDDAEGAYREDSINFDGIITFFNEDGKYDTEIRRILYNERIRQRTDLLAILNKVKEENPWIKYAYPDINRYQQKNLFVDLYYYNELFFKNNVWKQNRGYQLYLELLGRLINDPRISKAGYTKKTVFIPVLDWSHNPNTRMWIYRENINPISIIFELMRTNSNMIKTIFKDTNLVFFAKDKYFKLDFSTIEDIPKATMTLRRFITIITNNQEFDVEDIDTTFDNKETPAVMKANIIDKIEISKGVDITGKEEALKKANSETNKIVNGKKSSKAPIEYVDTSRGNIKSQKSPQSDAVEKEDKSTLTKSADTDKLKGKEADLEKLALAIDDIVQNSTDTDDALDRLDNSEIRSILIDLDNMKDDAVKIDAARASRMNELDQQFLNSTVKNKSIKDILSEENTNKELKVTSLKIDTPNNEWKEMKYMNFDRDYDLEKDIIACFYHFTKVSKPVSIRRLDITDNSTSEDRLDLYTVEMEDFKGQRFTVKLDIPKMVDNRFLLRGNSKSIQTQLFNMPIIKTNLDACQIVSNYQKIFIYRVNTISGRSHPTVGKFIKACDKYTGNKIKINTGNNSKICDKYELSVDYIDLASVLDKIETDEVIIYFNQDEIRSLYENVDDSYGIPYGYDKKGKKLLYYKITDYKPSIVSDIVMYMDKEFTDLYESVKPSTSGTYSRCNILSEKIPMVIICGYMEGLTKTLEKAKISYEIKEKLTNEEKVIGYYDYIKFSDGYLRYQATPNACMLLNGLKECSTDIYSIGDIDNKSMYIEFLDNYGGRIKADGLDNFYDCLIDPMTRECLEYYKLPTDVVSMLLYANALLCDNKFIKHTDTTSRRIRRGELVAAYAYEAISEGYSAYSNMIKHGRNGATISIKQSAVIDKILLSPISSDDSIINALYAVETTNAITFKGKAGLNSDRSYSLDKRTYDDSMLNVLGMSTNFSGNVGITRQATMDMNVEGSRGYIKSIESDTSKLNTAKSLCATEAMTPFGTTRDDSQRTYMTFVQTAKHMLRTEESDPLLITNGADQALPYLTIDKFAFKAKESGKIKEITDEYIIVEYYNGTKDYINLSETVEKNSDGGFYVPLKLDKMAGLKVGSRIEKGDILAYDKKSFSNSLGESDNLSYNIGKLVKVAIINTDEGFEDSGICSESLGKKLASRMIDKFEHVIDKDANVLKMLKVGDHVETEDPLIIWQDPHDDEEADTLLRIMGNNNSEEEISELGRKTIRSEFSGTISDIKIYRTVELEELSPSLRKIVEEYEAPIKKLKSKLDSEGIESSHLPATYKLEPTGKLKRAQQAVYIEFYIEYLDTMAVGDKIVYFSANKAIIKNILDKDNTPYTDFRPNEPIDAFVSEVSISKRMVSSTIINGSINKLLVELDRTIKDKLGIKYDDSTV